MRIRIVFTILLLLFVYACSHPIEIVGEGDVWSDGGRTCTLEDYQEERGNCSKNYVAEAYQETYYAVPRKGWRFHRWRNYCHNATDNTCSFDVPEEVVLLFLGAKLPPLKAIFVAEITDTIYVDGKEWAQVGCSRVLSWNRISAVCPRGICKGVLDGYVMDGWTWASVDDLNTLFNYYIGSEVLGPGPDASQWYSRSESAHRFRDDGWCGYSRNIAGFYDEIVGWTYSLEDDSRAYMAGSYWSVNEHFFTNYGENAEILEIYKSIGGWSRGGWFYRTP